MSVTVTPRLGLKKQDHRDPSWHTALNEGMDNADAKFFLSSSTFNHATSIKATTFVGSGLNDASSGGTFVGTRDKKYLVQIDSVGATDTFKWSDDGGQTFVATGVAITGLPQNLNEGVSIEFGATTGHTLNALWHFFARAAQPLNPNDIDGNGNARTADFVGQRFYAELDRVWWSAIATAGPNNWVRENNVERGLLSARPKNPLWEILFFATDTSTVFRWDATAYVWKPGIIEIASNPVFGVAGVLKIDTDTQDLWRDTGAALVTVRSLPPNHLSGYTISWVDVNTVTVAAGKARDRLDTRNLIRSSSLTKDILNDSAWAAGAPGNAMPSVAQGLGLAANEEYGLFVIGGPGITPDWGLDTSLTAANLLAAAGSAYTVYRRVGWLLTDASKNVREVLQFDDEFVLKIPVDAYDVTGDFNTANVIVTFVGGSVPPSVHAKFAVSWLGAAGGNSLTLFDAAATASSPSVSAPGTYLQAIADPISMWYVGRVSAARSIVARQSGGDTQTQLVLVCHSWIDTRDKDA